MHVPGGKPLEFAAAVLKRFFTSAQFKRCFFKIEHHPYHPYQSPAESNSDFVRVKARKNYVAERTKRSHGREMQHSKRMMFYYQ